MNRHSLDRFATSGERGLGASLVLVLAFFLGLASYKLWELALTTWWLDPLIVFLAVMSAIASILLVVSLLKHLSAQPRQPSPGGLFVVACVLVASGVAAIAWALVYELHDPRLHVPALISVGTGLRYLRTRSRPWARSFTQGGILEASESA